MAKVTETETPGITIQPFKAPEKSGVYDAHIDALLEAEKDPYYTEHTDESPSVTILVPNGEKNKKDEYIGVAKHIRYLQDSAHKVGRTARIMSQTDNGDGSSTLTVVLRDKIVRTRRSTEDTPEPADAA